MTFSRHIITGSSRGVLSSALLCVILWTGCSSSSELPPTGGSKPLGEHEKTFDPGAYRKATEEKPKDVQPKTTTAKEKPRRAFVDHIVTEMGFRIQLYSTTSIDEAQAQVASYRRRFDSLQVHAGRLDMTFDAPYYKVRMGDFFQRPPADSLRKHLHAQGMPEAWIVRDKVQKIVREWK
jgi:hypothetical protein